MSDIPRRSITRTAKLAGLPLGYAGRAAVGLGKRVGGRPAEAIAAELQLRTAEQLFSVLGELKGGAMKFGQALSIFESAMPEELAGPYREALTKLQEAAPPMPAERVHAILAAELGPRWRTTKFQSFDDTAVAAASIGQVHRAVWRDGREVAVKVQYPGAGPALMSDLQQLSRVARLAGAAFPNIDVGPIMAELRERMGEELDYEVEAHHQRTFARAFRGDADVLVPDVLAKAEHVLVTEWVEGTPLSRVIADGTREERDEAASLYLEFLLRGPNRALALHADPHPGNFRITPDGRLGVLDYGAVNRLPHGFPVEIGRLLCLALAGRSETVVDGLRELGFIKPGVRVDADTLLAYLEPFIEPFRYGEFTFSREWIRATSQHARDVRKPEFVVSTKLNLPREYVLIHRVWISGIGVLCQIGGTVPVRELLVAHLPGIDEDVLPAPL